MWRQTRSLVLTPISPSYDRLACHTICLLRKRLKRGRPVCLRCASAERGKTKMEPGMSSYVFSGICRVNSTLGIAKVTNPSSNIVHLTPKLGR